MSWQRIVVSVDDAQKYTDHEQIEKQGKKEGMVAIDGEAFDDVHVYETKIGDVQINGDSGDVQVTLNNAEILEVSIHNDEESEIQN